MNDRIDDLQSVQIMLWLWRAFITIGAYMAWTMWLS